MRNASAVRVGPRSVIAALTALALGLVGCTSSGSPDNPTVSQPRSVGARHSSGSSRPPSGRVGGPPAPPSHVFTIAFAGDVNFMDRTRDRLDRNPATVFAQ